MLIICIAIVLATVFQVALDHAIMQVRLHRYQTRYDADPNPDKKYDFR